MGRPTLFSEALTDAILDRVADGESLLTICAEEGMPCRKTVYNWLAANPDFAARYARAKEMMVESFAEDIIAIADDTNRDTISTEKGDSSETERIARARLRVDTRKWLMARLMPKKYGDRTAVEHSGTLNVPLTLEEFRARVAEAREAREV